MYSELNTKLQGRNSQSRKIANNTYLQRRGDNIVVKLHDTDVVVVQPDDTISLYTGGWYTPTTKTRINAAINSLGYMIVQSRGVWYVYHRGYNGENLGRFADGVTIKNGTVTGLVKDNPKADAKLKAKVRAYAQLCADAIPLDTPDSGDCWYCHMTTTEGESLGDAIKDTHHLDSHMRERYIVPSLVYRALKQYYNSNMAFWQAFKDSNWNGDREFGKQAVKKAVYRYILRRKGFSV